MKAKAHVKTPFPVQHDVLDLGAAFVEPRRLDQWFDRGITIIAEQIDTIGRSITDFAPQRKSALVVFRSLALRDRSRVVSLGVSDASAVSVAASPGYVRRGRLVHQSARHSDRTRGGSRDRNRRGGRHLAR